MLLSQYDVSTLLPAGSCFPAHIHETEGGVSGDTLQPGQGIPPARSVHLVVLAGSYDLFTLLAIVPRVYNILCIIASTKTPVHG